MTILKRKRFDAIFAIFSMKKVIAILIVIEGHKTKSAIVDLLNK